MTAAIEASGLTKRYGDLLAVSDLKLQIAPGEIFGLLGPNGAGKTTTILMLLGLTEPSAGTAQVMGHDPAREPLAVKRLTGYMPDNVGFYDELTGVQNLAYTADLNGIAPVEARRRMDALLARVGLTHAADRKAGTYSRGMRQRLGLADVLLKQPRVVILDEPTLGLDPTGAQEFLVMIRALARDDGMTVLLSSHLLQQVQQVCDRVGIFVGGRMLACGPIASLAHQILAHDPLLLEVEVEPRTPAVLATIKALAGVTLQEEKGSRLLLRCERDVRAELGRAVLAAGGSILHLQQGGRSLDDIYRRYFQGEVKGDAARSATTA